MTDSHQELRGASAGSSPALAWVWASVPWSRCCAERQNPLVSQRLESGPVPATQDKLGSWDKPANLPWLGVSSNFRAVFTQPPAAVQGENENVLEALRVYGR